jgi:LysM repeat protein
MNLKRFLRTLGILILIGLIAIGLTSCKLPASKGPQSASETNDGFPVPGETQQTGGIDVGTFATQTAQAVPPIIITPIEPTQNPTETYPNPEATSVPGAPVPTDTPIIYVTTTPGGPPSSYTLEQGEFPFCIARRFNVSIAELLTLNGLTLDSSFSAGQVLQIPQTGNPFEGTRSLHDHPGYYKIQSGDTLNTIACYFGDVSPDMIVLQNHLSSNDLPVGEVLIIP